MNWKIYLLSVICFFTGTSEFLIVGILDEVAKTAHISISEAGQLTSVFAITSAVGTPLTAYLFRSLNLKKILIIALATVIVGSVVFACTTSFPLMLISRVIMALGVGLFNVQCFVCATQLAPPEKKASVVSTVTLGFNASLIFGLPMGRVINSFLGWQSNFVILAIFCLLSILAIWNTIPEFAADKPKSFRNQLSALRNDKLMLSMATSFFWISGYAVFYTFVTPYLKDFATVPTRHLSTVFFIYGLATLLGNKLGAFFSEKHGVITVINACMLLNIAAMFCLALESMLPVLAIITVTVWALAVWAPGSLLRYNVLKLTPEAEHGLILSLYNSLVQVGVAFGATIGGLTIAHLPLIAVCFVTMSITLISLIFSVLLSRKA